MCQNSLRNKTKYQENLLKKMTYRIQKNTSLILIQTKKMNRNLIMKKIKTMISKTKKTKILKVMNIKINKDCQNTEVRQMKKKTKKKKLTG